MIMKGILRLTSRLAVANRKVSPKNHDLPALAMTDKIDTTILYISTIVPEIF